MAELEAEQAERLDAPGSDPHGLVHRRRRRRPAAGQGQEGRAADQRAVAPPRRRQEPGQDLGALQAPARRADVAVVEVMAERATGDPAERGRHDPPARRGPPPRRRPTERSSNSARSRRRHVRSRRACAISDRVAACACATSTASSAPGPGVVDGVELGATHHREAPEQRRPKTKLPGRERGERLLQTAPAERVGDERVGPQRDTDLCSSPEQVVRTAPGQLGSLVVVHVRQVEVAQRPEQAQRGRVTPALAVRADRRTRPTPRTRPAAGRRPAPAVRRPTSSAATSPATTTAAATADASPSGVQAVRGRRGPAVEAADRLPGRGQPGVHRVGVRPTAPAASASSACRKRTPVRRHLVEHALAHRRSEVVGGRRPSCVDVAAASTASGVPGPASAAAASSSAGVGVEPRQGPVEDLTDHTAAVGVVQQLPHEQRVPARSGLQLDRRRRVRGPAPRPAAAPPRRRGQRGAPADDTRRSESRRGMSGSWSRLVATSATGASPSARGSCSSTHTAIASAQWRSSRTTMTGADRASAPASDSRCSHRRSAAGSVGSPGGSTPSERYTPAPQLHRFADARRPPRRAAPASRTLAP